MAKDKPGFLTYHKDIEMFRDMLTMEELGKLWLALADLSKGDADRDPGNGYDVLTAAYRVMSEKIGRDAERYENVRKARSAAAKKRWDSSSDDENDMQNDANDANASFAMQTMPTVTVTKTETETETETVAVVVDETVTERGAIQSDGDDSMDITTDIDGDKPDEAGDGKEGVSTSPDVSTEYADAVGRPPSKKERAKLREATKTYGADWVSKAIDRAAIRGKPSTGYIMGILARWHDAGGPDTESLPPGAKKNGDSAQDYPQRDDNIEDLYMDFD